MLSYMPLVGGKKQSIKADSTNMKIQNDWKDLVSKWLIANELALNISATIRKMEGKISSKEHKCYKYFSLRNQKPFYYFANIYPIRCVFTQHILSNYKNIMNYTYVTILLLLFLMKSYVKYEMLFLAKHTDTTS